MKARSTQFLLMHCPEATVEELDDLCRQNYLTRTELLVIALRSMAAYMEDLQASPPGDQLKTWLESRRQKLEYPAACTGEEEEMVLMAAEEEEEDPLPSISPEAEIEDIDLWADLHTRHKSDWE